ncbi:MAG: helicase-related protein [bacterium]
MPRIFDNIEQKLLSGLRNSFQQADRADICVGYFNLRGWRLLDARIQEWADPEQHCRILVGMQKHPHEEFREFMSLKEEMGIDNQTALRLKKKIIQDFREQLILGAPTNEDEKGLQRLAEQIRNKKVVIKLFLRHPLHAKLYLFYRPNDVDNPITGYLGSSNLTVPGLEKQGELNIDVLDHDACNKLKKWFEDRWKDKFCLDVTDDLLTVIEESWARTDLVPPYHIYLKMAYHLSQEARFGLREFKIPSDFNNKLFEFQTAAVKIAAHHLNKRNGVLIGDVVGLGKTLMATALARIFEDDQSLETLIICPKNLVKMWEDYQHRYRLRGKVLSMSKVITNLPDLRRYRIVLLDESHNLRNRNRKRYRAIQEYIRENDSKCILLTATPYNKTYQDLSNQLRLFVEEDRDIGIRPENLIREIGDTEFIRRHQCPLRSLAAFEKSEYPDDWRELMRLYMVRRTRSFIKQNYALTDTVNGRKYLLLENGEKSFFPERIPRTVKFSLDDKDQSDQYAWLYSQPVVDAINSLTLPRYGLGNYIAPKPHTPPTSREAEQMKALSRAGKRLMGFCRTNLFKRLESSGIAFIQSIERHILRNYIYIYAIEHDLELPIGTQNAEYLDPQLYDEDIDLPDLFYNEDDDAEFNNGVHTSTSIRTGGVFLEIGGQVYNTYSDVFKNRFKWLRPGLFVKELKKDLKKDCDTLLKVLAICKEWSPEHDTKLHALHQLITKQHPHEKVLVFSQFADTVRYLHEQLALKKVSQIASVTGKTDDPTALAQRFSPRSNEKQDVISPRDEIRVLIATDILSEGQNLQDCAIIVNYDLPWAIIRLIQRAGRVDRIGQQAESILCYSFLPAEGVDQIINLRTRVRNRLKQNAEVVGADEAFFEDEMDKQTLLDIYNEKSGIMDGDDESEVDLASYAYQIWKNAIEKDPKLEKVIPSLPNVIFSSRNHQPDDTHPEGVLVYMKTSEENDALAYINRKGKSITESQFEILKIAECAPDTPAFPHHPEHHALVEAGVKHIVQEEKLVGGQLGSPRGARFRTYERLKHYLEKLQDTPLFDSADLRKAHEEIYKYPLKQSAIDTLNRQLRAGIDDGPLAELVMQLREEDRLCNVDEQEEIPEPHIICSMGLFQHEGGEE